MLCWKEDDTFSEYEFRLLLNSVGYSLAGIAESTGAPLFDRIALEVRQRAAHIDIDRQDALERLFMSALALRDTALCEKIIKRLQGMGAPSARIRELQTMMSNYLGDANGTD